MNKWKDMVQTLVSEKLGCKYEVVVTDIVKNNGVRKEALVITGENHIGRVVYLGEVLAKFYAGKKIELLVDEILELCEDRNVDKKVIELVFEFERVKELLGMHLVNTEMNRKMLSEVPHIVWNDLSIVFYINMEKIVGETSIMLVTSSMLRLWGVTPDDLAKAAFQYAPMHIPYTFDSLHEILAEMLDMEIEDEIPMYVLSNENKYYGAAAVVYPDALKEIGEKLDQTCFYMLPSSVHEFLILPQGNWSPEELSEMVRSVNETMVSREELLSDHVYWVDLENGKVTIAA